MGEVVCRVDLPFIPRSLMRFVANAVGGQIPHLRVRVVKVLLHSKRGLLWLVFSIPHGSKLRQRLGDGTMAMDTCVSCFTESPATRSLDIRFWAVYERGRITGRMMDLSLLEQWQTYAPSSSISRSASSYRRSNCSLEWVIRAGANPSHRTISPID